jgi:hypothetical protein
MFIDRRTRLAHGVLDQPRRVPPATLDEYRAAFDAASNLYGAEEISEKDFNLVTLVLAQVYLS